MTLTTRGRRTEARRKTPLWYIREGDCLYCFSGWGDSSDWYRNLKSNPSATVQLGKDRWETHGVFISESAEQRRIQDKFLRKYGRLMHLVYHMDRLALVKFRLAGPKGVTQD